MNRAISTVLLTGATGFLGSHLLAGLLAKGYQVVLLKRSGSSVARIAEHLSRISAFDVDRVSFASVFEAAPIDAVIHAATAYGRKGENPSDIVAANIVLGMQLMEAAAEHAVPLFVNTGTFSAKGTELPETLDWYVLTKRHFSEYASRFAAGSRMALVELQLEHVYGPGDDEAKFVPTLLKALIEGRPAFDLTRGEQHRDFVYVDDVVAAYLQVLERRAELRASPRRIEVGSGQAVALADFVRLAHNIAGSGTELNFGALPYRAGEMPHSVADISALRRIGWEPRIDLREGLARTIRSMRQPSGGAAA